LDGVRVTTRVERRVADVVEPSRQLGIGDAKRVKAVTEAPSAPRRGATVTTDVDGDSLLHGLWIAASSLEGEVGALVCRLARGPQRSQGDDALIGTSASAVDVDPDGFDL